MNNSKSFQLIFSFLEAITNTEVGADVDDQGNYATSKANAAISRNDDGSFERWRRYHLCCCSVIVYRSSRLDVSAFALG